MHGWSALILAAGAGRRFAGEGGGRKLLADIAGVPVIRRVAASVVDAGFAEVIAITGSEDAKIRCVLAGLDMSICRAAGWEEGMAASLRAGVAALVPDTGGVCVFLGDMPLVPVTLCKPLIAAAEAAGYAARPQCGGKPGHPVAFTRAAFAELAALEGDSGAGALLRARPDVAYLDTDDRGVLFDVDTPADLAVVEAAWNACATSATSDSATARGALPKP